MACVLSEGHYTRLFSICQVLNEINRGYLAGKGAKGTKGDLKHEGTKVHEGEKAPQRAPRTQRRIFAAKRHKRHKVFFDRIYRMIGIAAVEGASPEPLCGSLGTKTVHALSKRASSGPDCFGPGDFVAWRSLFLSI